MTMIDPVGAEKAIAGAIELMAHHLAQGKTFAQVRAQMLAFEAFNARTKDEYLKVWYTARADDLMDQEIRLDNAFGPLGEYLAHKGELMKKNEAAASRLAESDDHPGSASLREELGL